MTDANNLPPIAIFPTLPPRPPAHVVPTLFNQERRDWEDSKKAFYCFLGTTKRAESPSSILGSENHDLTDIMKHIFAYVKFKIMSMDKVNYRYKVKMLMCQCTAHVVVEALATKGGWRESSRRNTANLFEQQQGSDEFCGVLISRTGLDMSLHEEIMAHLAQLCNIEDGSYYTEGQLRSSWKQIGGGRHCAGIGMTPCMGTGSNGMFMAAAMAQLLPGFTIPRISCEFCEGTSPVPEVPLPQRPPPEHGAAAAAAVATAPEFHRYRCNKLCMALPGDTIYWKFLEPDNRIAVRWETATDEDLVERGYIEQPGMIGQQSQQGYLFFMCQAYRAGN